MKNKIIFILTFIVSLFLFTTNVNALAKVSLKEETNGKINSTFHFEEGFVGGIEATFKVTGDVKVEDFEFSSKINSSNYTKSVKKDLDNNSIVVRVTTGGIGSKHNLLSDKKELTLGTLIVSSSKEENTQYKVELSALSIVDNNWDTQVISNKIATQNEFTYTSSKEEETPPREEEKEEDTNNSDENSNQNTENNTGTSNGENNNNNNDNNTPNQGNELDTNPSDTTTDNTEDKDKVDNNDKDAGEESTKTNSNMRWIIPLVIVIVAFGIIILVCYLYSKKDKDEIKL